MSRQFSFIGMMLALEELYSDAADFAVTIGLNADVLQEERFGLG